MFLKSYKYTIACLLLLQIVVITNCYHHHDHQHHRHHHHHVHDNHHRRHTEGEPKVYETNSYKKIVTIQKSGEEPVENRYEWSTSNQSPDSNLDSKLLSQTIRRITTQTLTEDNVIDNKPVNSDRSFQASKPSSPNVYENISYNISITSSNSPQANLTCPQNHYGNIISGCKKCQCNDNIDLTDLDNCDPLTGRCLKCLYNTEGLHCDVCQPGYAGDATKQQCHLCVCNQLGTNPKGGPCHPATGQCACYPHVEGSDCAKCKPGYFNFSSGIGCDPCNCDSLGSESKSCNEFDGKCQCRSGFGGLKCDECPMGQFGDPKSRCQQCNCNRDGSVNQYCNSKTGKCECNKGIGGHKCDKCARGYHGKFPDCESCGECFEQWDEIVTGLKNQTQALLDRVKLLLEIGTVGKYGPQFAEIERNLDEIKYILDNQKLNKEDLLKLADHIKELGELLLSLEKKLDQYQKEAERTTNRTTAVKNALNDYDELADKLNALIKHLENAAAEFKEANVDGAYNTILQSQNRSRAAEKRIKDLKPLLLEQEQKRRATDLSFTSTSSRYNSSSLQNEAILAALARQIFELENNVPGINKLVCASSSTVNTCDQLCGGALCSKCGGLSCSEGATTKASNALTLAQQAMDLLNQKYNQSRLDLDSLNEAKNKSDEALKQAKLVMADCELQKSKFDKIGNELNGIMDGVDKFALMDGARPAEVRTLGQECLALSISLKPEQILDLARKINETLSSLTNIDKILRDTAADLNTAEQLYEQANRAKEMADNILAVVEKVLEMLRLAAIEQAKAAAAIAAATLEIEGAQADITEITSETDRLLKLIADLTDAVKKLRDRLNELRKKYTQNELYVTQAKAAAEDASKLTDQAEKGADELTDKVRLAEEKLRNKARLNGELKDRAERLKNDAYQLAADILGKLNRLRELDDLFDEQVKRLKDYQDIVDDLHKQMNQYLRDIDAKAQHYRDCQS